MLRAIQSSFPKQILLPRVLLLLALLLAILTLRYGFLWTPREIKVKRERNRGTMNNDTTVGFGQGVWHFAAPMPVNYVYNCNQRSLTLPHNPESKDVLLVLLWNRPYQSDLLAKNDTVAFFQQCGNWMWTYTQDRSRLAEADIVEVFFYPDLIDLPQLSNHQLMCALTTEAQPFTQVMRALVDRGVHLLRSPSIYADLPHNFEPTGDCYIKSVREELIIPFVNKSTIPVAALISNCDTSSGREHVLKALMHKLPLHSYGQCLHNVKPPDNKVPIREHMMVYKFFLSIENRLCRQYITEKFAVNFKQQTIPIVASFQDRYPDYRPRRPHNNSYVNVLDFANISDVARHIQTVANSEDLFYSYHRYRGENGTVLPEFVQRFGPTTAHDPGGYCSLAAKITNPVAQEMLRKRHLKPEDITDCVMKDRLLKTIFQI